MNKPSKLTPHLIAIGIFITGSTIGLFFGDEAGRRILLVLLFILIFVEICILIHQFFSKKRDNSTAHILADIQAFDEHFELIFYDKTEIIIKYENLQKFYINTYSYAESKKYSAKYCVIFTTSLDNFFRLGETQQIYDKFIVKFEEELYERVSVAISKANAEIKKMKQKEEEEERLRIKAAEEERLRREEEERLRLEEEEERRKREEEERLRLEEEEKLRREEEERRRREEEDRHRKEEEIKQKTELAKFIKAHITLNFPSTLSDVCNIFGVNNAKIENVFHKSFVFCVYHKIDDQECIDDSLLATFRTWKLFDILIRDKNVTEFILRAIQNEIGMKELYQTAKFWAKENDNVQIFLQSNYNNILDRAIEALLFHFHTEERISKYKDYDKFPESVSDFFSDTKMSQKENLIDFVENVLSYKEQEEIVELLTDIAIYGIENSDYNLSTIISIFLHTEERAKQIEAALLTRQVLSHVKITENKSEKISHKKQTEIDFDSMDGYGFERYVGHLLLKKGYKNITVTQKSGDFGVDITAEKDSIVYAIQCKYYTGPVGVNAVNEVKGGMAHYRAHVGVVITNSTFTNQAIQLARENKIVLWNVKQLLDRSENDDNQ